MANNEFVRELLEAPFPCAITTLDEDGRPYGVVVWCAPEGDQVTVNGGESRWLRNLRRDPRVSLVVVDTANILRHVAVQGTVVGIEPDPEYAHIDSLSQIYEGRRYQYELPEDAPRFKVTIRPDRIKTLDFAPPQKEIR
jgi:PPOX class probable F420-dependent enzyme